MPQQACKKAAASVVLLQSGRVIFISCCLSPLPEPELVSLSGQVLLCLNKNGSVALALHTSSLAFLFVFDNLSIWLTTSLPLWGLTFLWLGSSQESCGERDREGEKKLLFQIFLLMSVFISDCFPLSLSAHFCSQLSARFPSYTLLPRGHMLLSSNSLWSLILITNSNLITSILNNSFEAPDSLAPSRAIPPLAICRALHRITLHQFAPISIIFTFVPLFLHFVP